MNSWIVQGYLQTSTAVAKKTRIMHRCLTHVGTRCIRSVNQPTTKELKFIQVMWYELPTARVAVAPHTRLFDHRFQQAFRLLSTFNATRTTGYCTFPRMDFTLVRLVYKTAAVLQKPGNLTHAHNTRDMRLCFLPIAASPRRMRCCPSRSPYLTLRDPWDKRPRILRMQS